MRPKRLTTESLLAESSPADQRMVSCLWKHDEWHDYYDTQCGNALCLETGTPKANNYNFCPCCGGEIVYKPAEAANDQAQ